MKVWNSWRVMFLTALFLVAMASVSFAADRRDFCIINHTGQAITQLNVCPTSSEDWQEDILGAGVIPADEDCYVSMDLAEKGRYWDILAFLEDGSYSTYSHIDLYNISYVTLGKNGSVSIE